MKAILINSYGEVDILEINSEVPKPALKSGQLLVENKAASINPIDGKIRRGYLKDNMPLNFPVILGGDFSGKVFKIGDDVDGVSIGDEVYGQAIEDHLKLKKNQKLLIHGAAGGIGHLALQIARSIGSFIAVTVSQQDKDFVKKLGADQVIDYQNEKFEEKLKDFDAVFDTVGGEVTDKSFKVLKKGGVLVSMVGISNQSLAQNNNITAISQFTQTDNAHLNRLAELVDKGIIKVNIAKIFPLDNIKEAFNFQEQGHPRGKVVLKI